MVSGDCDEEETQSLGGKFLGIGYCPKTDQISMKFSTAIRTDNKKTSKPKTIDIADMTDSEVEDLLNITAPLTKRKVLAFMQAQYDPLGLVAPLLLKGKVMLRKLYGKEYTGGWDDPLKSKLATEWLTYIKELVRHGPLNFPRTVITEELRELWLVGFWDGSSHAHSAVIYARCWNVNMWDEETFDSNILVSKTQVAPITGSTIPRMELQGLLQSYSYQVS